MTFPSGPLVTSRRLWTVSLYAERSNWPRVCSEILINASLLYVRPQTALAANKFAPEKFGARRSGGKKRVVASEMQAEFHLPPEAEKFVFEW